MSTTKKESPVEAEVINGKVGVGKGYCCRKGAGGGFFWGSILLILGTFLILQNYLSIDLMKYFFPIVLLLLGGMLIVRSFNN